MNTSLLLPTFYRGVIGRELAIARMRSTMSAAHVAETVGVAVGDLVRMEAGLTPWSSVQLREWCRCLGVAESALLEWADRVAPPTVRGVVLDLRLVAALPHKSAGHKLNEHLAGWAQRLLGQRGSRFIAVTESDIHVMALRWNTPVAHLIALLHDLTPLEVPGRDAAAWLADLGNRLSGNGDHPIRDFG
ncbi:MAG TPA: hypothetical protein VFW65_29245 [Pseudonocardiaceae bacterium]|nr:hypothetical protein [Pseudonocardiaceae bacterium]